MEIMVNQYKNMKKKILCMFTFTFLLLEMKIKANQTF